MTIVHRSVALSRPLKKKRVHQALTLLLVHQLFGDLKEETEFLLQIEESKKNILALFK